MHSPDFAKFAPNVAFLVVNGGRDQASSGPSGHSRSSLAAACTMLTKHAWLTCWASGPKGAARAAPSRASSASTGQRA
jgi:hypothetical protein